MLKHLLPETPMTQISPFPPLAVPHPSGTVFPHRKAGSTVVVLQFGQGVIHRFLTPVPSIFSIKLLSPTWFAFESHPSQQWECYISAALIALMETTGNARPLLASFACRKNLIMPLHFVSIRNNL